MRAGAASGRDGALVDMENLREHPTGNTGTTELGRGCSVGRYLIVALVGRGGMGEVYAAYDPELDRKVAVKLLRARSNAGADGSEGRARLLREAQAIARLSDPNVVVVYDVGTFEDRVFLAMEFVDGNTLGYWLAAQARSWREIVETFVGAGRGLAAAHRAGIVHRDFKPDNVMIGRDGKIRVMDFGLARAFDTDEARAARTTSTPTGARRVTGEGPAVRDAGAVAAWNEDDTATRDLSAAAEPTAADLTDLFNSRLTMTGAMMGTPAYMAPEQFEGRAVDARTDQFSFCAALYEALYGERPFQGSNLLELSKNVSAGRVRPAPHQARIPWWLRKLLLRGLRVHAPERHASMDELLAALARDPARSRRRLMGFATVGILVTVLGVGLVQARREQRMRCLGAETKLAGIWDLPGGRGLSPRKEAVRRAFLATGKRYAADSFTVVMNALDRYVTEWNNMHREACEATNLRGEQSADVLDLRMSCLTDRLSEVRSLTTVFSSADGDVVSKSVQAAQALRPVEQCSDITALRAVVRPPDDPVVRRAVSDVRTRLSDIKAYTDAGQYKKAATDIDTIIRAARSTNYAPVIAEALAHLGRLELEEWDLVAAEKSYEEAVWMAEASRHDEVAAEAAAQLVAAVGAQPNRQVEGERWGRHAKSVLSRLGAGHDVLAAWTSNNLAITYASHGDPQKALQAFQDALRMKIAALGEEHADVAVTLTNIAYVENQLGRTEQAIVDNDRALRIMERTIGSENPLYANNLANAAELANAMGKFGEAQRLAERALAMFEREFDGPNSNLATALAALGQSLVEQRQYGRAIPHLNRALAMEGTTALDRKILGEIQIALARARSQVSMR